MNTDINIDFDAMLNRTLSAASRATAEFIKNHPENEVTARQAELIASVTAKITVDLLREYHAAFVAAHSCTCPSSADTH